MYCFINEIEWNAALSRIPLALKEKFVSGVEELGANLGLDCIASEPGWLQIRIKGTPQGLFQWFQDAHIVAVEVEAADIVPLLGKTFDALVLKRSIENGNSLGRLEPHELMNALREAAWSLQATSDDPAVTTGIYRDAAAFDLVHSGLMTQREVDAGDPFEGLSEPASGRYDGGPNRGGLPVEMTETQPDQFDPFQ